MKARIQISVAVFKASVKVFLTQASCIEPFNDLVFGATW